MNALDAFADDVLAFLLEDTWQADPVAANYRAHLGDAVAAPRITRRLIDVPAPHPSCRSVANTHAGEPLPELTTRVNEICVLIPGGEADGEINGELLLREPTATSHAKEVVGKLCVPTGMETGTRTSEFTARQR